jgi:hypothetical protein
MAARAGFDSRLTENIYTEHLTAHPPQRTSVRIRRNHLSISAIPLVPDVDRIAGQGRMVRFPEP